MKQLQEYTLTDLQKYSIERMSKVSASILALSPGVGKTLTILSFVIDVLFKDNNDKCIFMIPKSARAAFIKEMENRIGEPYYLITAETSKKYSYQEMAKHRYIFIENTLVNRFVEDLVSLANTNACHLVIDEAHSLQNPGSVFTKAAWEIRCYCKRIYAMTATPLMNSIEGLFNLCHFVFPAIFKSWFKFRDRYCITKENVIHMKNRNGARIQRKVIEIIGYKNMPELNNLLDKLIIKGCIHYNVNFEFIDCELDIECEKLYRLASNGLYDMLYHKDKAQARLEKKMSYLKNKNENDIDNKKDFGARLHDIQRVVDFGDGQLGDNFVSSKMKLMCQKVFEIMQRNESTLIYFEYTDSLDVAEKILTEQQQMLGFKKIYRLTGSEKEDYRSKIESNLSEREIVLCSQAASQSRNLQKSNNLIIVDLMFSVGRLVQCCGRICRTDTTFDTQNIYILTTKGTIDEYKTTLLKDHLSLIKTLLGNEAMGAVEDCEYLDIDKSSMKELKNNLLWRRGK